MLILATGTWLGSNAIILQRGRGYLRAVLAQEPGRQPSEQAARLLGVSLPGFAGRRGAFWTALFALSFVLGALLDFSVLFLLAVSLILACFWGIQEVQGGWEAPRFRDETERVAERSISFQISEAGLNVLEWFSYLAVLCLASTLLVEAARLL